MPPPRHLNAEGRSRVLGGWSFREWSQSSGG